MEIISVTVTNKNENINTNRKDETSSIYFVLFLLFKNYAVNMRKERTENKKKRVFTFADRELNAFPLLFINSTWSQRVPLFLQTVKEHLISIRICKIGEGRLFNIEEYFQEREKVLLQVLGQSKFSNKRELESQIPSKENLVTFGPFIAKCRQWLQSQLPT